MTVTPTNRISETTFTIVYPQATVNGTAPTTITTPNYAGVDWGNDDGQPKTYVHTNYAATYETEKNRHDRRRELALSRKKKKPNKRRW